jgi:O-antigen/teichoic acid export membrane protein
VFSETDRTGERVTASRVSLARAPRIRVALTALVITGVEGLAGASVWLTLLLYSRFYSPEAYARLVPWLACQQLITVVAPFGSTTAIAKLLNRGDQALASRVYAFLPRYTLLNLPWAVPMALLLTWVSTRGSFSQASWWEALLTVGTGAVGASQRAQQQVSVLRGQTRRYTIERTMFGVVSFAAGFAGAHARLPSLAAFFGGQCVGFVVVALMRRTYQAQPVVATPTSAMYLEVFKQSWVLGALSIFGWFSGLGVTIVLSRHTTPLTIGVYGQALAAVSLVQLCLGGGATALQAHFISRSQRWDETVERRLNIVFDGLIIAAAATAVALILLHAESWSALASLRLRWPPYIWAYLFSAVASLTLYQRVMLRHTYDLNVDLSWFNLAIGEVLALSAFAAVLNSHPDMPLAANAALLAARTTTLFFLHEPRALGAQLRKTRTLALGISLAVVVWRVSA